MPEGMAWGRGPREDPDMGRGRGNQQQNLETHLLRLKVCPGVNNPTHQYRLEASLVAALLEKTQLNVSQPCAVIPAYWAVLGGLWPADTREAVVLPSPWC